MRAHSIMLATIWAGATLALVVSGMAAEKEKSLKGYDITKTGLTPRYPTDKICRPLTSFYASWDDVDGTRRDEAHSGVDGGRIGDPILAPAAGRVVAVWQANWGWGEEQAVLIRHDQEDLGISGMRPVEYFSEFDHLNLAEPINLSAGQIIQRGQQIATVSRPGGNKAYLPEVHWEVWEIPTDASITWKKNKFGGRYWIVESGRLIDPLYMMSLNGKISGDLSVDVRPFDSEYDYTNFKGFTYIFPCKKLASDKK